MSASRKIIPPEVLLEAYSRLAGNITATAKELGCDRQTVRNCLAMYGADKKPVTGGTVKPLKHNVLPLPDKGKVKRYLLSSAQNNTKVFMPFWRNLLAYKEWLGDCDIMVARFSYNKNKYLNPKSQKPGTIKPDDADNLWFDENINPYICDEPDTHGTCRWQLAPDLFWCSEMNILPTAVNPLSDLKTYTGTDSSIFPHTKVAMQPVPTLLCSQTPYVKHLYTTGTVTGRNYIKKKAGLKAEFHHTFACLLVEVNDEGSWWCRQVIADHKGDFYDLPGGEIVKVSGEEVTKGHTLEAINWGDVHVNDMPQDRLERYWGEHNSVIDILKPRYQFFHDTLSFRSRTHHEMRSFSLMLAKHVSGQELVEEELKKTISFLARSERQGTLSVVVKSNHDEHGSVWLDTADYKADLPNVEVFLEAQLDRVRAIKRGDLKDWTFLEWAARKYGAPETIRFLKSRESFIICGKYGHPIECSLHGDKGPNGARGSTANLSTLGCKTNKGHDHSATIKEGVYSAGTCAEDQGYNEDNGATTWSVSHIGTYKNGKRAILTERDGRLWA